MKRSIRLSVAAGILAPFVFSATVLVVASGVPNYSHVKHALSTLGSPRSPGSELMNGVGFGVTGLLVGLFAFAFPLVQGVHAATSIAFISWFLAGIGFLGLGVWPFPDPQHMDLVLYCLFAATAGTVAGAWSVSLTHRAAWYWALSFLSAMSALDMLRLPLAEMLGEGGTFGLWQRVHLAVLGVWLVVTACLLSFIVRDQSRALAQPG